MKNLTVLIFFIILISSCSSTKWTHGEWSGMGKQIDNATWEVILKVSDNDEFTIEYPDLSCGGNWKVTGNGTTSSKTNSSKSKFKKLILRETIEHGTINCDQGVEVHLIQTDHPNEIDVIYYLRSYDPENPIATATLTKKQ